MQLDAQFPTAEAERDAVIEPIKGGNRAGAGWECSQGREASS